MTTADERQIRYQRLRDAFVRLRASIDEVSSALSDVLTVLHANHEETLEHVAALADQLATDEDRIRRVEKRRLEGERGE